jgi:hypothetical protein
MSSGPVVWRLDAHEEWASCGPVRASICKDAPDEKNIVTVKVRIALVDAWASDDTPTYLYVPVGGLAECIESLKRDLERELLLRAELGDQ